MHIVLTYCWGNVNPGDRAITPGTLELLQRQFPACHITVVIQGKEGTEDYNNTVSYLNEEFPRVSLVPNPVPFFRIFRPRFIHAIVNGMALIMSLILPKLFSTASVKNRGLQALLTADVVVFNGGHMFFWNNRMGEKVHGLLRTYPLLMARRLGIPYGLYAQSFGPFEFRWTSQPIKKYYQWLLSGSQFITSRESISQRHIQDLCVNSNAKLGIVLDSAFSLNVEEGDQAKRVLENCKVRSGSFIAMAIRLTTRGSSERLQEDRYESYARKLAQFVSLWIAETNLPVLLVCHLPGDVEDVEHIVSLLSESQRNMCHVIPHGLSAGELKDLYRLAIFVLGIRFHALVFALSECVPTMGLYYYDVGPKVKGMMEDFGLDDDTFDMDNMNPKKLYSRARQLMNDRDCVSANLREQLSVKRLRSNELIKEVIEQCLNLASVSVNK